MLLTRLIDDKSHKNLLLIFSGWSTEATLYADIAQVLPKGWDMAVATDFLSEDFNWESLKRRYTSIYVLAWSLGMAAADRLLPENFSAALVGVNGTILPSSDIYGIPEKIYTGTLENLDIRNLKKFQRRMFADSAIYKATLPQLPDAENADIPRLKEELRYFQSFSAQTPRHKWTRIYIAENDAIIPASNQRAIWQQSHHQDILISIPGGHCPDFKSIVASILPDTEKISESFEKAHSTYNNNAEAQEKIAETLGEYVKIYLDWRKETSADKPASHLRVLEIGAGTGLFTRQYIPQLPEPEAVYLDLYPITPFNIARNEDYIVADGEEWLAACNTEFDLIVSASAVQWFVNPHNFFEQAFRHLKQDGALIFSTFLPGNLTELDKARLPMLYRNYEQLNESLSKYFKIIKTGEDTIILKFNTIRDAIMHLKHTGVKGSHKVTKLASLTETMSSDMDITLTYRPAYFLAIRK